MFEMILGRNNYISCIKINGEPILPPLMTPERYNEMQKYKEQAKAVEFRIAQRKKAKECILQAENLIHINCINDNQLVPSEETNCDIINDFKKHESISTQSETNLSHLPSKEHNIEIIENYQPTSKCNNNLCASLFKNHFELDKPSVEKVIDLLDTTNAQCSLKSESYVIEKPSTENPPDSTQGESEETLTNLESNRPRLIRQNSYTLDTPSPMLKALIESNASTTSTNTLTPVTSENKDQNQGYTSDQGNSTERSKRRSCWDLISAKEKWSSFESNIDLVIIPTKINVKNVKPRVHQQKSSSLPPSPSPSPTKQLVDTKQNDIKITRSISSATNEQKTSKKGVVVKKVVTQSINQLKEKEITILKPCFPSDNSSLCNSSDQTQKIIVNPSNEPLDTETPQKQSSVVSTFSSPPENQVKLNNLIANEQKIREIYAAIQKEHSKRMTELILRQKKEQEMLMKQLKQQETFFIEKLKKSCVNLPINTPECERPISISTANDISVGDIESELDDLSSQTIQLSPDNLTINSSFDNNYIRIRSASEASYLDTDRNETPLRDHPRGDDGSSQYKTPMRLHVTNYTNISSFENCNIQNTFIYNRGVFRKGNTEEQNQKLLAAVITIQAYIRGYLVRRLLQTERVRTLIQTVKDTLLCALEFHNDNTDDIQPADIELHRRLIQQLTAACYAIHDIFFKLSTKEKMMIINLDRQRMKEKLLRPPSANKSSPILSSTTQKTIQRKLQRSISSTPSSYIEKGMRTCKVASENQKLGTTTITSLLSSPLTAKTRRPLSQNKKPWR